MGISINTNYSNPSMYYAKTNPKKEQTIPDSGTTSANKAQPDAEKNLSSGVIYDRSGSKIDNSDYSINKMSRSDRQLVINQLNSATEQRQNQLLSLVQKTLSGQAGKHNIATGTDIWKTLASGNFTVDPATKAQAQKDIGEDGYWGVKQTSQRLFDFASALAGDDVEMMKKMQNAMEKGFKQATAAWGKELPSICSDTMAAANNLFEEYYRSKESGSDIQ
jgi:hypothetical protein